MIKNKIISTAAGTLMALSLCFAHVMVSHADETQPQPQPVSASISSCEITPDKENIRVSASYSGDMQGMDGRFYLFELQPYQNSITGRRDFLISAPAGDTLTFTTTLDRNTVSDKLYSKFVVAAYNGTDFVQVSEPHYITNPEMVASNTAPFNDPLTKKGLNIEISMLGDAFELGVKHVGTNIAFNQILGEGIDYTYDGKTYHFNKTVIEGYDKTISALSGKGMTVTAIILNGWNDATPDLIYPGTKKSSRALYYLFNVHTQAGLEQTKAMASFLAERYNGTNPNHGKISNWVIGNEINNQEWNYMGPTDIGTYVQAYQDAFRVFYTAIKSASANDRVYFSLDYNWNHEIDGSIKYGGKNIVDYFNSFANLQGQFEWGLAYHPYPAPMTEPEFWDDDQGGLCTNDINSPVINFKNLTVLTDYFATDALTLRSGHVRNIILTEQGFTAKSASRGNVPEIQAAAYAYSYYLVDSNPHIDAYILSRQIDAPSEVNTGFAFGLWECDMNQPNSIVATKRRKIWQVFKNIDKKTQTLENTEFAKSIIGISKWSDVIPNFKWRSQEQ